MKVLQKNSVLSLFILLFTNLDIQAQIDLTKYLPKGYITNGTADYTAYLQRGLDENKNVMMPDFPVLVNKKGLNLHNNQTIIFQKKSSLIMQSNAEANYGMIHVVDVENVKIQNPKLVGDRDRHLGKAGEWGMGINILSSKNIIINNSQITNLWGDGIYIGEIQHKDRARYSRKYFFSQNIVIDGGVLDNNRRNGISIISVKNLLIKNILIQNTNGTLPMAGIDIEPNNNEQYLENIRISNVITKNNSEVGIKYVTSNFLGFREKNVTILIENCRDYGSKVALILGGARVDNSYKIKPKKVIGKIKIVDFKSFDNRNAIQFGSIQKYNPPINFKSFFIYENQERDLKKEKKLKNELSKKKIQFQ